MRHDGPGDRELRARLSELADAAGRAATRPSPAGVPRRRPRGRMARRATAVVAVALGALAGPAAVGAGLVSFSTSDDPRPARTSPTPAAPAAGPILPPAAPPGTPPGSEQPPSTAAEPSPDAPEPTRAPGTSGVPPVTPPQQIWLSDGEDRDGAGCARPTPARRTIDEYYPGLQALRLVLTGPAPGEATRGLRSAPAVAGLTIRTYGVVGRTARVDFNPLPKGATLPPRPCRVVELMQPMDRTLVQFTNISQVRYSIQGSETAFYRDLIGIDVPGG